MKQMASRLKESSSLAPLEANALLSPQNLNVGAYARTAAIGFYAFVECFVNSVGQDYILRHPTIDKDRKEYLKGKKGKRYLSTEHKLEKYPAYIRADRKSPIVISDPLQRIEPYKWFVERIKDVRDAANHYGSGKADIWRSPGDWLRLANDACAICVDVAKGFWTACYPDRDQPSYLFRLDRKKFMHLAQSRADLENQARSEAQDAAVPPEDS